MFTRKTTKGMDLLDFSEITNLRFSFLLSFFLRFQSLKSKFYWLSRLLNETEFSAFYIKGQTKSNERLSTLQGSILNWFLT